jgi:cysteinyl-tRNA synthetase
MRLYNSLTRQKEVFSPIKPGALSLYVCGVTVYDRCHIGHARTYTVFDILVRYFRYLNYSVTYVRNITDIDDKIIKRAQELGVPMDDVVEKNIQKMHADFDALNLLRPDLEPRATKTIDQMLRFITALIAEGYAYHASNQDVYYRVEKFANYGKLSGQSLEDLRAGERVEINSVKESPLDFVLWKAAKAGEPSWDSPWGKGRPGWHIECSAMTYESLGANFDIHGGGSDLRFPHHENEIAQSVPVCGGHYANLWMHSAMVQINGEKMAKSLGNFFLIEDVLKQYPAEIIRYFLIGTHYRSEISYSEENLNLAKAGLTRLYTSIRGIELKPAPVKSVYRDQFHAAMQEDLNMPEVLAVLFELAREINISKDPELAGLLVELAGVLGILQNSPEAFLQGDNRANEDEGAAFRQEVEALVAARTEARRAKNFAESDRLRTVLDQMGVIVEDSASGASWRRK